MKIKRYWFAAAVLAFGLVLCGCSGDDEVRIDSLSVSSNASTEGEEPSQEVSREEPESAYLYVTGAVNSPGVYEFSQGERYFSLIEKAGGFREDAAVESVNLAGFPVDGSEIRILTREEYAYLKAGQSAAPGEGETASGGNSLININTAPASELTTLSGIGESRAEAIIFYRSENGSFKSKEEIKNVSGIKDGLYNKIKDRITV